jgi:hypothetical protein
MPSELEVFATGGGDGESMVFTAGGESKGPGSDGRR